MDVKNAFLNGILQVTFYISQPLGFKNVTFQHMYANSRPYMVLSRHHVLGSIVSAIFCLHLDLNQAVQTVLSLFSSRSQMWLFYFCMR